MTKTEALAKIKELEDYIKEFDNEVGFKDDTIFLLSREEYKKYKDVIPQINTIWWLRSPGCYDETTAYVGSSGFVNDFGDHVSSDTVGIRPTLKFTQALLSFYPDSRGIRIGDKIRKYGYTWVCIDSEKRLFIAEVPIWFDKFDDNSNDYENSYVRQFLKDWLRDRS